MANAPTLPLVSVDEYLNTSYEHDVEYVDGVLIERGLPEGPVRLGGVVPAAAGQETLSLITFNAR